MSQLLTTVSALFTPTRHHSYSELGLWFLFLFLALLELLFGSLLVLDGVECSPWSAAADKELWKYPPANVSLETVGGLGKVNWALSDFVLNKDFVNINCENEIKQYTLSMTIFTALNVLLTGIFMSISSSYINQIRVRADDIVEMDDDVDDDVILKANAGLIVQINRFLYFKVAIIFCYMAAISLRYSFIAIIGNQRGVDGGTFYFFQCGGDRNFVWQMMERHAMLFRCVFNHIRLSTLLTSLITVVRAILGCAVLYSMYRLYRYRQNGEWLTRSVSDSSPAAGLAGVLDVLGLHERKLHRQARGAPTQMRRDDALSERSISRRELRQSLSIDGESSFGSRPRLSLNDRLRDGSLSSEGMAQVADLASDLAKVPELLAIISSQGPAPTPSASAATPGETALTPESAQLMGIVVKLLQHPEVNSILLRIMRRGLCVLASDSALASASPQLQQTLIYLATDAAAGAALSDALGNVLSVQSREAAAASSASTRDRKARLRSRARQQSTQLSLLNVSALGFGPHALPGPQSRKLALVRGRDPEAVSWTSSASSSSTHASTTGSSAASGAVSTGARLPTGAHLHARPSSSPHDIQLAIPKQGYFVDDVDP
ncbi:uncharacterized protein AMSG_09137 [Thecamonas trahens ATCC 50062]|uniref:Uncharacterized protein n=1 Tax=Thecamonas trahens ATCC 50062 TaxID=461836 RepID=A0A0L0DLP5_THETB|nr:hypothetical protein AMSG_09137 [Thecamonas trahens ATCC 50062]KNC52966.1 hypothetical protein AMSG_09137 [Thecamonas trahens ATCC 50062]|eukprot:XP_013754858.1 hypothetical protein AMSG_09137 [Thecamonas trahens ATCC 50062]